MSSTSSSTSFKKCQKDYLAERDQARHVPSGTLVSLLLEHDEEFDTFGVKNSHIIRRALNNLFIKDNLSNDSRFMVYFFCSLMRNYQRMKTAVHQLPEEFSKTTWFTEVSKFIDNRIVAYPINENLMKSVACIHISSANPPMALYCIMLARADKGYLYEDLMGEVVTAQIHLEETVQEEQKEAMKELWENQITTSRRDDSETSFRSVKAEDGSSRGVFDQRIYETQKNDQYPLLTPDFAVYQVKDDGSGGPYSKDDLEKYLLLWKEHKTGLKTEIQGHKKRVREATASVQIPSQLPSTTGMDTNE